jgi:hypothetical protein
VGAHARRAGVAGLHPGIGATYWIVEHFQKKHINFHATAPPTPHTEVEHKIEMVKKNNVDSAPPDLKRIVTTAVSTISLPEVPEVPQPDEITPTTISGVTGQMGSGMGNGNGTGAGSGGLDENLPLVEQLSKLLFELPSLSDSNPGQCARFDDHSFIVHIPDGQPHTCNLRVRGVVEQATYDGGTRIKDYLNVGGTPNTTNYNIYELNVDDPPQTYYLNAGKSGINTLFVINYSMHIDVKDGSKITLHADSIDSIEVPNLSHLSVPDEIPEHPIAIKQPFNGQFIQVDTISIDD